ncbi:hypothetical protein IAU59_001583 [Kwoniella sp. CBS 9459]
MSSNVAQQGREQDGDLDDEVLQERDGDSGKEDSPHEDGDNRTTSSQVRKAQNRIAQREFRLRKQQYIRDLEARVEVLSGDKEERVELMTLLVRNLLKENKDLRNMVKDMASFIGEGLGSCLPRLGLSANQLDAILNRADTDTAYEAFVNLKASREMQETNPGIQMGERRRRPSESMPFKRKRDSTEETTPNQSQARGSSRGRMRNLSAGLTPGSTRSAKGKERETDTMVDGVGNYATDGVWRPRPSRSGTPQGSYDFLFPDLETMWSGGGSSGDNRFATPSAPRAQPLPQSFSENSRLGYAQHLLVDDERIPLPPTENGLPPPIARPQIQADLPERSRMYPVTPEGGLGFGPMVPGPSGASPAAMARSSERSISSLAGPRPPTFGYAAPSNYARSHAPLMSSDINVSEIEKRENLRHTVGYTLQADPTGNLDGPGLTAAEVAERRRQQDQLMKMIEEGDPSDRKMEAMQLITYHLNNFRLNPEYRLPPALRPTGVQRTVPHEHAIDGIIFPTVRERMIILRGRYDLVEVFHSMMNEFAIHGDDILDYNNYEVSEKFIEDYGILIDDQVINVANKWRAQRGVPPIIRRSSRDDNAPPPGLRIGPEVRELPRHRPRNL